MTAYPRACIVQIGRIFCLCLVEHMGLEKNFISSLACVCVGESAGIRDPQSSRRWDAKTNGHHVTSLI